MISKKVLPLTITGARNPLHLLGYLVLFAIFEMFKIQFMQFVDHTTLLSIIMIIDTTPFVSETSHIGTGNTLPSKVGLNKSSVKSFHNILTNPLK